jgi:hypothetical protein
MSTVTQRVEWFKGGSVDDSDQRQDFTVVVPAGGSIQVMVSLSGVVFASPHALAQWEGDQAERDRQPYALAGVMKVGNTWVAEARQIPVGSGITVVDPETLLPTWHGMADPPTIEVRLATCHARAHVSILVTQLRPSLSDVIKDGIRDTVAPSRPFGP